MKFIKKHINTIVAILVFILVLAAIFILKGIFFPEENKAIYGNRLEGREKVEISNSTKDKIKAVFQEKASSVEVRIAGRIVYIDATVGKDVTVDNVKSLADDALKVFTDAEKAYYDIQVIVDNPENTEKFPIMGYKHHTKSGYSWTKNR